METAEGSPEKKRNGLAKLVLWIVGIGFVILIIAMASGNNSSGSGGSTAASDVSADPITSACQQYSSSSSQSVSYKDLEKDPTSFQGQSTTFTGQVVQIEESNGGGYMRLAVDKDAYGDWNTSDIVFVQYDGHNAAVDDDVVTVNGVMEGSETYTSQANFQVSVPLMYGCSIQEASAKTTTKASAAASAKITPAPTPTQTTYTTPSGAVVTGGGSTVTAPPAPPASWHTAETFTGDNQKNTQPFTIQGSQWRVTYQETGQGYFGADAESPDGSGSYCAIANLVGSGSDTTYCYGAGNYYVSVNTDNPWTIMVEDYY